MIEKEPDRNPFDFTPYLNLFYSRRKTIAIAGAAILVFSLVYAFCIPKKEYNSSISFLPPLSNDQSLLSAYSAMAPSGTQTYDVSNDQIALMFESKDMKRRIIDKFDLYTKFKIARNPNRFEIAAKKLDKILTIEGIEKGFMSYSKMLVFTISAYGPTSDTAFLLGTYSFNLLDSAIRSVSSDRAGRYRGYLETQLATNKLKLDSLQRTLVAFQENNKALNLPEQIKGSLNSYAEIKSALIVNELKLKRLKSEFSGDLPEIREIEKENEIYRDKMMHMETDTASNLFPSFNKYRELYPQYSNMMSEIKVQENLLVYLQKELAQAKLQEQKAISGLIIIDPPVRPDHEARPKRVKLAIEIFLGCFVLFLAVIVIAEVFEKRSILARIRGGKEA